MSGNDLVVTVRVTPRAKHNAIAGVRNGMLEIRCTAPPADGKANKVVARALADYLDVAPSKVTLLRGRTSRTKQFLVISAANGL